MTVDAFVDAARRFNALLDDPEALGRDAFIREVQPRLADVYAAALSLSGGDPAEDSETPTFMTRDEWWSLFQRLQRQLGEYDSVVDGSPADDLADIYLDLGRGLVLYDSGNPAEAVWHWRSAFDSHWGRHAAQAIFALQVLRSESVA